MATGLSLEHIISFLLGTPMFGDLDAHELSEIVHIMQVQYVRAEQILFREGHLGDAWYVVFEGELEVVGGRPTSPHARTLARLGPAACFGEMSILDGSPRSASVRAIKASTVFKFPRADFLDLLDDGNLAAFKLVYHMARQLAIRQRQTTARLNDLLREHEDQRVHDELSPIVEVSSTAE